MLINHFAEQTETLQKSIGEKHAVSNVIHYIDNGTATSLHRKQTAA